MQKTIGLLRFWLGGVRLYIGLAAVLVTLGVWWWSNTIFGSTPLAIIRTQEIYGWLSVGLLALTLAIGPVVKLYPNIPGKPLIRDSRRALGISAAWFGLLHTTVVYFKQFNGINPLQLPSTYQWSMLLGLVALIILLLMAATSVNAIMRAWGIWWFRLHRLVYLAVIATLVHAFMIGAHAPQTTALTSLGVLALVWICMNIAVLIRSDTVTVRQIILVSLSIIILTATMTYGLDRRFAQIRAAEAAQGHGH